MDEHTLSTADLIVVLGGDGTMIASARMVGECDVLVLGINYGGLGYLTDFRIEELFPALEAIIAGDYEIDRRVMLDAELHHDGELAALGRVLNDVVINKSALARIIEIEVKLNGLFVNSFRSDGLIVSTPTGSTAYNLSAGGPILHPALAAIVVTPICPHTLSQRPLVVPASTEIRVRVVGPERRDGGVYLTLDGQEGFPIVAGIPVDVRSSASAVTLLRPPDSDHFDQLAGKLSWGV